MKKVPLWFCFFLSLFFSVCTPILFPQVRIFAAAAFLAILYSRSSFLPSIWLATCQGLCLDLISSYSRFGLQALNLCLTTLLLYRYKRHFFEDKPIALSCFAALISSVSTLIQLCLGPMADQGISLSWQLIFLDLLFMPCLDGIYAYLCFFSAMKIYQKIAAVEFRALCKHVLQKLRPKKANANDAGE